MDLNELITIWIGGSNHPVSLVDEPDFRAVINRINPNVSMILLVYYRSVILIRSYSRSPYLVDRP